MTFGAFCPLPLRLRDNSLDGWTATSHARACADATAVKRQAPFAWFTYSPSGGPSFTILEYTALNGTGLGFSGAPSGAIMGTGDAQFEFPKSATDAYGVADPVGIVHAKATAHGTTAIKAVVQIVNSRTVRVRTFTSNTGAAVDAKVTLKVWAHCNAAVAPVQDTDVATVRPEGRPAWSHDADIGDYGGDLDKEAVQTEETPYAWVWYRELGGMIGSSFTTERTGEVHAKKLALARNMMGVDRAAERARNNGLPRTADECLGAWVKVQGITVGENERRWRIRRKADAQFAALLGPTRGNIDQAISDLLGDSLIEIIRNEGASLSVPPTQTFWPGVNPGPAAYNLGGGPWLSERSSLRVIVRRPTDADIGAFLRLMNIDLFRLLDRLLPAWTDFGWSVESDGFFLDLSSLDLEGLTPS